MARGKVDPVVSAYMAKIGKKGAKLGGIAAAASMTPEQRSARAKKAAAASVTVRAKNAAAKKAAAKKKAK
jgi:hypothetical protein